MLRFHFGEYGLLAMEPGWVTARQIEAARRTLVHAMKRRGKVWIRIFPDKPYTQKPPETRMGKGKGNVEYWVAVVKPGRVMFEVGGLDEATAREALGLAQHKFAIKTKIIARHDVDGRRAGMKTEEIRKMSVEEMQGKLSDMREELMKLRFQQVTGQLTDTSRLRMLRRDIARMETILNETDPDGCTGR